MAAPLPLSRRTTLGLSAATLATGLLALSGCDERDTPTPGAAPGTTAGADPDAALLAEVRADLAGAEQDATAAGLTELAALHRAHLEALDVGGGSPDASAPSPSATLPEPSGSASAGPTAPPTLGAAVVRRRERALQRRLAAAALAAQSGGLARLLASMSAAVSQRLAGGLA